MTNHYYVYKITNLQTKKVSIGITTNNSTYILVGYEKYQSQLKSSINSLGEVNFKKEILSSWETKEEAQKEKRKIYQQLNKNKIKKTKDRYISKNIESIKNYNKTYQKKYREENKEYLNTQNKIYREINKEKIKERRKINSNKEQINKQSKIYRDSNKEKIKKSQANFYLKNKERLLEKSKQRYRNKLLDDANNKIKNGNDATDYCFYTLKFVHKTSNHTFFKYGITKYNPLIRFGSGFNQFNITVLDTIYGSYNYIKSIERKHLYESIDDIYIFPDDIPFKNGKSECRNSLIKSLKIV